MQLLLRSKDELEKLVKQVKNEALEAEKKATDYYQQLLKSQENLQVVQSEVRLLSNEITAKQHETGKLERERLALERELLQLRPLKNQLENYSQSAQKQIEESVRVEHERGKLASALREALHERDMAKTEVAEVQAKFATVTSQNAKLLEQLRMFEKESFELEARIRRGIEVERENQNMTRTQEQQREKERELARSIEELKGVIRQKDMEIDRLNGKQDNVSYFQRTLEGEL